MTDLDALLATFPPEPERIVLPRTPQRHRHEWLLGGVSSVCMRCGKERDESSRRGRSARRLGADGERRSEKRYGMRKVGEFGGPDDLSNDLFLAQQKTTRRAAPLRWKSIFAALDARAGGRTPLLILSYVHHGRETEDFVVLRGRDWAALARHRR